MDNTCKSNQTGGYSNLSSLLLLLFLAGLQPALSTPTTTLEPGPQIEFFGLSYVTVGVPYSIQCLAPNCPACTYSMSMDKQKVQDNVLAFTVNSWVNTLTVSCTATNAETQLSATATTSLQGLAGPANVSITGPGVMNPTVSHTYSCHANCRPSCFYAWKLNQGPWVRGQGNVISITPQEMHSLSTLNCKATNTISGLFVSATKTINVTSGPSEMQINGPDVIEEAEVAKFVCTAQCLPSCRYVLSVEGQTVKGNEVEISVDEDLQSITLKCDAQNIVSKKINTAVKTVQVKAYTGIGKIGLRNPSTRPTETLAVLLLAFIISTVFTL